MSGLLSGLLPHLFGGQTGAAPTNITPAAAQPALYQKPSLFDWVGNGAPAMGGFGGLGMRGRLGWTGNLGWTPYMSGSMRPNPAMLGMGMGLAGGQGWGAGIGQGLQMGGQLMQQQRQAAMQQQLQQMLKTRQLGADAGPQPSPNATLPGVY